MQVHPSPRVTISSRASKPKSEAPGKIAQCVASRCLAHQTTWLQQDRHRKPALQPVVWLSTLSLRMVMMLNSPSLAACCLGPAPHPSLSRAIAPAKRQARRGALPRLRPPDPGKMESWRTPVGCRQSLSTSGEHSACEPPPYQKELEQEGPPACPGAAFPALPHQLRCSET